MSDTVTKNMDSILLYIQIIIQRNDYNSNINHNNNNNQKNNALRCNLHEKVQCNIRGTALLLFLWRNAEESLPVQYVLYMCIMCARAFHS